MGQVIDHSLADPGADHFAEFEAETIDNMLLLNWRLAQPEQTRLGVIFAERGAALANFFAVDALGEGLKAAAFGRRRRFTRPVVVY